jgi:asparagine synthase (glutamine-hydrolysing)
MVFASEVKSLINQCAMVSPFPPGHFYDGEAFHSYLDLGIVKGAYLTDETKILTGIRTLLTEAVHKRLQSDAEVGFLLSGGLDSSLVCAIAQKFYKKPIRTFSVGMETDAIDSKYAKIVADYIGADHTNILMTKEEVLSALREVIYHLETWDITTIRASMGMYLICKAIHKTTDIKVLLTGEGSDELTSGYLYFHNAPSPQESHLENIRLLKDIHRFDGLRVDRAMSCHGLEVRIPFLDPEFVELYLSLPKHIRMASYGMEKQLFRDAFINTNLLPHEVLYRKKEAFSDGTSSNEKSWFQIIQEEVDRNISDEEFQSNKNKYDFNRPDTKEKYYYRKVFEEHFGSKSKHVIPYYWLPKWCGNVSDPSARVLEVYKK